MFINDILEPKDKYVLLGNISEILNLLPCDISPNQVLII